MPAKSSRKIFVLDTSVILHDFNALYSFQEHDVAIPITVLEEVDRFKKGNEMVNYHAREFIRGLDKISHENLINKWIPLDGAGYGKFRVLVDEDAEVDSAVLFGAKSEDHRILNTALALSRSESKRRVVLITKDINLRVKARALNLEAEDYETDTIKNLDHLYGGKSEIKLKDKSPIDKLFSEEGLTPADLEIDTPPFNHYFILKHASASALAFYYPSEERMEHVAKNKAYGITPKNAEQTFALHAIMNPEVPLVTISGTAGTGKTLLALSGALEQRSLYKQIFLARPIVPLSNKDIGYLPGDVQSKINPYMQPLWDNLNFIKNQYEQSDKEYKKIEELISTEKLLVTPLAYIRGRSLANILFIVDEAQNLTPHEVKTIITRAGEHTKIVFTGDIYQIDTPYLDEHSNGLSYLIDKMSNHPLYAHIHMEKGERSELANLASERL